jgi:hypothetical protein
VTKTKTKTMTLSITVGIVSAFLQEDPQMGKKVKKRHKSF